MNRIFAGKKMFQILISLHQSGIVHYYGKAEHNRYLYIDTNCINKVTRIGYSLLLFMFKQMEIVWQRESKKRTNQSSVLLQYK